MKKVVGLIIFAVAAWNAAPGRGQEAVDPVAAKYAAPLAKLFELRERFAPLHPALEKVYPVAVVENKTFHIFEPSLKDGSYRQVAAAPDTFDIPVGVRAAMPLAFWGNRMACVVTGEVFDEPAGAVIIFHEFVHCAEWDCCEQKLKEGLAIFQDAMKRQDYMWELQFPFRYANPAFIKAYRALLEAWDAGDDTASARERGALRDALTPAEWEYLTWQEWKEGLARHLENRMRSLLGLAENVNGGGPLFDRVTFYRGGDKLIRALERSRPGISHDLEGLFRAISAKPGA